MTNPNGTTTQKLADILSKAETANALKEKQCEEKRLEKGN